MEARPALTRFATNFLTWKSLMEQKITFQSMFTSVAWKTSKFASKSDIVDVEHVILLDGEFGKQSNIA